MDPVVPKPRKVSLIPICKPLADLVTENKKYYNGQLILAVDALGKTGIKRGDWMWLTDDISAATPFNDLPWVLAPEQAGTSGFTPFKVRNTDASYAIDGDDAIITDQRLIGATEPVITCTKDNREYRDSELVIDAVAGTVKILGFYSMDPDDHISVIVPSIIKTADTVDALIPIITELQKYAAPFSAGGGMILWNKPAALIPAGWQEVEEMRGMLPMGCDPDDADFKPEWTKTGGTKTHKIDSTDKIKKFSLFTVVDQTVNTDSHPATTGRSLSGIRSFIKYWFKLDAIGKESYELYGSDADNVQPTLSPTSAIGKDDPDAINHLNPYRIVTYIEPIPV